MPLGVWEGLQFVIMALPGLFSYLFFSDSDHIPVSEIRMCQINKVIAFWDSETASRAKSKKKCKLDCLHSQEFLLLLKW